MVSTFPVLVHQTISPRERAGSGDESSFEQGTNSEFSNTVVSFLGWINDFH